jgi:hypothetical protein
MLVVGFYRHLYIIVTEIKQMRVIFVIFVSLMDETRLAVEHANREARL